MYHGFLVTKYRWLPHNIALLIFISVIMSSWMIYEHKNEEYRQEKYRLILSALNQVSARLQDIISNNLVITESLAAILKAKSYELNAQQFNVIAHDLMLTRKELRSIQLAPNAITEHIYPEQQNMSRSNVLPKVELQDLIRTFNEHQYYLTGPEALLQGGKGFILSKPIYKEVGKHTEFWGIITIVIDLNTVLRDSGLLNHDSEILYALRTTNHNENTIYISGKRVLFELDSIMKHVVLYNLPLDIAAFPQQGWYEDGWQGYIIVLVGIIAALFISSLSFLLMRSPVYLQQRINESNRELKNKSRELKIEKQWHESLLDTTPDLIFYKDTNGVYITCNQAFANYLGFNKDDIIGKTDEELLPHEMAGFFHLLDKNYLENPEYQHNEEWIETTQGRTLTLDTIKMPVFDDNDELLGIFGISRDNSELGQQRT